MNNIQLDLDNKCIKIDGVEYGMFEKRKPISDFTEKEMFDFYCQIEKSNQPPKENNDVESKYKSHYDGKLWHPDAKLFSYNDLIRCINDNKFSGYDKFLKRFEPPQSEVSNGDGFEIVAELKNLLKRWERIIAGVPSNPEVETFKICISELETIIRVCKKN